MKKGVLPSATLAPEGDVPARANRGKPRHAPGTMVKQTRKAAAKLKPGSAAQSARVYGRRSSGIDLDNYAPAYFTFIATKLASRAGATYRKHFGVGIEIWRVLVMLAIDEKISVNMVCKLIGMDKGSVSRCFKSMYEKGLVTFSSDPNDGRVRYATLTRAGHEKHERIKAVALERQRALLSCLTSEEAKVLIKLLRRLHTNLPNVEIETAAFVREHVIDED